MDKDKFDKLIERAKQDSKEDFLKFVTGIYGVDECVFDHIWDVPVIKPGEGDALITTSLSTKTEDELLDIVNEFIAQQLGDSDGCFISLNKMNSEFTDEELEEWKEKIDNGDLKLDYNAIIVYNEYELQQQYEDLIKANYEKEKQKTPEELDQIFLDYVNGIITHERCHLNANYFVTAVRNNEFVSEEINGAELSFLEEDDLLTKNENTIARSTIYRNRNEVLIDTLRQMMNNYQEGNSVEDCLFKIIENRKGKSQYKDFDDLEVLTMYTLFPEELTEWATFGAYDFIRENKLQKMIMKVCGTDIQLPFTHLKKKVEKYATTLEEGTLSEKQIKMLEMLGFSITRKINKEELKEVATSPIALGVFSGSLLDIKAFMQSIQKEDTIQEQ